MSADQREQMLSDVLRLGEACPHDGTNPDFCPLHEVRKFDRAGRIRWCNGLADADLEYLARYHQICLQWRATAT